MFMTQVLSSQQRLFSVYCSIDDITIRMSAEMLTRLTRGTDSSTSVDESVLSAAISDASAVIDNMLGQRYAIPIDDSTGYLKKVCIDVAVYHIYRHRYDNEIPKEVKNTYTAAIATLESIQMGKLSLIGVADVRSQYVVKTNKTSKDRVFTDDLLSRV